MCPLTSVLGVIELVVVINGGPSSRGQHILWH